MLSDAVCTSLVGVLESVKNSPSDAKNVPPDATVHVLTSNLVRALRRLFKCEPGYAVFVRHALSKVK